MPDAWVSALAVATTPLALADVAYVVQGGVSKKTTMADVWAGLVQTAWTAVTFQNSWADYGSPFQPCQYRMVGDEVEVRGLVQSGTVGSGTPVFTLPVGFRPPNTEIFATTSIDAFAEVRALADGSVSVITGSNTWVSLNGVTFSIL